jgi:outer membrane receptor protein involved in Fe transport
MAGCHVNPCRLLLTSLLMSTVSPIAIAQQAQPSTASASPTPGAVDEIVVTAERRSEAVKDVPMSITAISSATIQKFDIQDLADYIKDAPNVSFGEGVGAGGPSFGSGVQGALGVSIRGISGYNTTAFYIDDTPLPDSLDPRILDTDHIEVLRGPQGTLFGASSMGGLIRVITKQADPNTFSGTIDTQGFDLSHGGAPGGETSVVLNIPLVQNLASMRISAFDSYVPGYLKRTYDDPAALNVTGQPVPGPAKTVDNVGASHEEGASVTFRVTPTPDLVLTPVVIWQRTTGVGFPLADYDPNNLIQRRILDVGEGSNDEFLFAAFTASYTTPFGRFVSSTSWLNRETYDLEDGADANSAALSPTLLLPAPGIGMAHTDTFTEEDRFESNFNFPVQMVAGIFYDNVKSNFFNQITLPGLDQEPDTPFDTNTAWLLNSDQRTTQLAGFVALTYKPFAPLEIAVGGRESHLTNSTYALSGGIFGTGLSQTNVSENAFTPRVSAKYTFTPDTMVYATAAQGFRVGGANAPLGSACGGFGYNTSEQIPYGSDSLWSYEVGVKTAALNDRLSMSLDGYHIDWSKIQQNEVLADGQNACFASLTLNLGQASSDGGELEANARVTDDFSIRVAGGYEDARLTKVAPGTSYYVGEPLSGVPKWTATASGDYEFPREWGSYFIRGQYSFTGDSMSYSEVATGLLRKAYQLVDLRLGANYHSYTLTVFAKNLFDARPNLSDEVPVSALAPGRYRYLVGLPRELGVDLRYHF